MCTDVSEQKYQWEGDRMISVRGAYLCVYACDCCVNQSLRSDVPTFKGKKMGQKVSRQIKAKVASRSVMKSMGSKSPETKEEERQETATARDCVIEIVSESKEIKEEEVSVVDQFTTLEEMLLRMAKAIIARNETQKKQAELMPKDVDKEDAEPKETMGLYWKRELRNSRT